MNGRPSPKMPGRPTDANAKEEMLAVALNIFAEKGYESTSIRNIAEKAGVNSALVSYHFKGKEGLFSQTVARFTEKLLKTFLRNSGPQSSPKEQIKAILSSLGNVLIKNKKLPRIGAMVLLGNNKRTKKILLDQVGLPTHRELIDLFAHVEKKEKFEFCTPRNSAMIAFGTVIFWGLFADDFAETYGFKNGDEMRNAALNSVTSLIDHSLQD